MRPGVVNAAAGDRLYNFVTDAINMPVGGYGVYTQFIDSSAPELNSGNPIAIDDANILAGVTAAVDQYGNTAAGPINYIQFIQHRDKSNDRTPLYESTLEQSPKINGSCFLRATGRGATTKQNSSWIIGDQDGTIGAVPVNDETEYIVNSGLRGWRVDLYNGNNTPWKAARFTTPDYFASTIYTTEVQRRDHLLQHLAYDYNEQRTQMHVDSVAICLENPAVTVPSGANNANTLTTVAGLSAGDVIIIGFTDAGQPIKLTLDNDLIQTFGDMFAPGNPYGLTGAEVIIPYARPTTANTAVAGRIIAGGVAPGGDAEVSQLIFVALDQAEAYYDEASQTKDRIQIGLESGFNSATTTGELTDASEGSGYHEEVLQYYRDTHGHRKYIGNKPWQQYFVEFPQELVPGSIYDIFIIDSCDNAVASSGMPSFSPQRTIIAVQNQEVEGFVGYTGVVNPQKTFVQNVINEFMTTTIYPHTPINV
jgi:hypothetical protein